MASTSSSLAQLECRSSLETIGYMARSRSKRTERDLTSALKSLDAVSKQQVCRCRVKMFLVSPVNRLLVCANAGGVAR